MLKKFLRKIIILTVVTTILMSVQTVKALEKSNLSDNISLSYLDMSSMDNLSSSIDKIIEDSIQQEDELTIKKADEIIESVIKPGMTDFEKELALYNCVVDNIEYSTEPWKVPYNIKNRRTYAVLVNGKGDCIAYANLISLLMNRAGIKCIIVSNDAHAWNMVKIENDWYHLDATYGDATGIENNFNLADNQIVFNHKFDMNKYPLCNNVKYNYKNYMYCKDYGISLDDSMRIISGQVSLPKGDIAENDINIKVHARKTIYREDRKDIKPYDNYQCETTVVIPKGADYAEYSLVVPAFNDGFMVYYSLQSLKNKYESTGAYDESSKIEMTNSSCGSLVDVSADNKKVNLRILNLGEYKYVDPLTLEIQKRNRKV